jgi:mycothiol synthase
VAVDGDEVVGWVVPVHDDLTVALPHRRRGHGSRLVVAGRLLAGADGRSHFRAWVPRAHGPEAFARANGMAYDSSLWKLRLDPSVPQVTASFPEDVAVRWIEAGTDDEAFTELVNTTFLDHPSPLEVDLATIRRVHGSRGFDPSTILLVAPAADPGRLIGFCRVGAFLEDDGRLVGEVRHVGVRREARGRGLGRELVRWGIAACRERGAVDVYLAVEGANAGALRLYESHGFRPDVEWPHWTVGAIAPGP